MQRYRNVLTLGALLAGTSLMSLSAYAAKPVDLSHHKLSALHSMMHDMQETKRLVGPGNKLHVRVQQTYAGYPVWGGDAVIHIPHGAKTGKAMSNVMASASANKATMNGVVYQNLKRDLAKTPKYVFSKAQAKKALNEAQNQFRHQIGMPVELTQEASDLMVYVDDSNKAHWVYKVSFFMDSPRDDMMPQNPIYLMDAKTFDVYKSWDNAHRAVPEGDLVDGGGFGGNAKVGQLTYDGGTDNLASFQLTRDASTGTCYLYNPLVRTKRVSARGEIVNVPCAETDPEHNNVYWTGKLDAVNGGHSPLNDGMYTAQLMNNMFQTWYGMPMVANDDGSPKQMSMIYHFKYSGAIYSGGVLSMGDGLASLYHPFTTRDIIAHEMAHALVEQYSHLSYLGDSAAVDEAFGDMTAKAAEYFATGSNTWDYGADVVKKEGEALRYLDDPTKDCNGREPGDNCSIAHMKDHKPELMAHHKAGVLNKFFHIVSTTRGWNTKAAYDIMVNANMHYWTANTDIQQAGCGIVSATKDLGYDVTVINSTLYTLGINYADCGTEEA